MTQTDILVADSHVELRDRLNAFLREHRRSNVRLLQIVTQGERNYALLVAWEEE